MALHTIITDGDKVIKPYYDNEAHRMEFDAYYQGEYIRTFKTETAARVELDRLALEATKRAA